jgi:signal transduction histidine kinase
LNLGKQIRLGFALMLLLMLIIAGLSIYNVYSLNEAASNLEGRYSTLYKLSENPDGEVEAEPGLGKEMVEQAIDLVDKQLTYNYTYVLIVVGVALVFGGFITALFPAKIIRPIERLVQATQKVKKGDYSFRIEDVGESDEISILANSFNDMLRNIDDTNKKNVELIEETKRFNETLREKVDEATRAIREQQNELIKSERLATIGEFAARIAHEIKNPLSGITVALEMMRGKSENGELDKSISEVLTEVRRLDGILKDLLQLSIPKEMDFRMTDPNDIVERSVMLVNSRAQDKGVSIDTELNCGRQFPLDSEKCQQVVMNLIINAVDAVESGTGKVEINTESDGDNLYIKISDNGPGIPEMARGKIFEPFYSNKKSGTGLGLPISKKIIQSHNGSIEVSSEEGRGTTFTITIPGDAGEEAKEAV